MNPWAQRAFQIATQVGHPDPALFVRQMQAESGLNPNAVSPAGAQGIAQIMPATARGWGVDPTDPVASLTAAAKNMSRYYHSYNGDWARALAAYNAGPGAVQQYNGVPPYAETRNYIKKIMSGHSPSPQGPQRPQNGSQAPQTGSVNPTAVSNQINRISYAYSDDPILAQPHIDKLSKSLLGGGLANNTQGPAGAAATTNMGPGAAGYFRTPNGLVANRREGEAVWEFFQRLGQKGFGLKNDAGNHQTTGGGHTEGSYHYSGQAIDFGNGLNPVDKLNTFYNWLKPRQETVGYQELLMEDPGTSNHHVHIGGYSPNPPPSIRPANTRRRPVKRVRTQTNAPR